MRRLLALGLLALAVHPAMASAAWVGGHAPRNILIGELVAEPDGTLVALDAFGVSASIGGPALVRQPARGLPRGVGLGGLQTVAGGLEVIAGGSLYASADHGASWTRKGDLGDLAGNESSQPDIVSWALDPDQPDRLIQIHRDGAIQRSLDGGATWLSAFPLDPVDGFLIGDGSAVFSGGSVYAVLDGKAWRSDDVAATWHPLADVPAGQLVAIPGAPGRLWLVTEDGLFRSDDGGGTWHARGAVAGTLVPSPVDPAVAWEVALDGVRLTRDAGITWRSVGGLPPSRGPGLFGFLPPVALAPLPSGPASACVAESLAIWCSLDGARFALDLVRVGASRDLIDGFQVDPLVSRRAVAVVGSLVWETTDGSVTWHLLAAPLDLYGSLAITPAGTFLAGRRHVIFLPRSGGTWRVRTGPGGGAFLLADPVTGTLYAGTPGHLWRAPPDGRFRKVRGAGLRGGYVPVSVGGRGRTVIALRGERFVISTDGGRAFRKLVGPRGFFFALAAPHARRHLMAFANGLYVSRDAGATWRRATNVVTITVAADPAHAGRWFGLWHRHLQVSTDDGATWRPFRVAAPTHPGSIVCCGLAVSPGRLWWIAAPSFFDATPVSIYSRRLRG